MPYACENCGYYVDDPVDEYQDPPTSCFNCGGKMVYTD